MARIRELLRRWFCGIPPRFWAFCFALAALGSVIAALDSTTRFYTVTATGDETVYLQAPAVSWCGEDYVLAQANITAADDDLILHTDSGNWQAALHVERTFALQLTDGGGKPTEYTVEKGTVAEILQRLGITLGTEDFVEPALETPVTRATGNIIVHRITYHDYIVDEVLPFETQYDYSSLYYRNPKRQIVLQQGRDGHKTAEMQDKLLDGEVVETKTVAIVEDTLPVPEIIKTYKAGAPVSKVEAPPGITINENGEPSSYSTVYSMKATGYYSARGRGSSGLGLYYGTFAVDPTLIPYGTKVYIVSENGKLVYGWAIATDTGLFVQSNRMQVDLFYETYAESAMNGVHQVRVYIP